MRQDLIAHVRRVQRVVETVGIGLTGTMLAERESNPALIAAFRERAVRPSRHARGASCKRAFAKG